MIYIISTIFSVLLGTLTTNLLHIERVTGRPSALKVYSHFQPNNALRVSLMLTLFIVDWIIFILIFPPSKSLEFAPQDILLLMMYIPALGSLAFAVIMALENDASFCLPLKWYHILSLTAEISWIIWLVRKHETITGQQAGDLLMVIGGYLLIKIWLCFALNKKHKNPADKIASELLAFVGIVTKIALIVTISNTSSLPIFR
ncbi:hypothetical protein ACX8XN_08265 [Calditrichota bacterium GD2]